MIKGVIFDLDGVIIQGDCDFGAWFKLFADFGIKLTKETCKEFSGMKGAEIVKKYCGVKDEKLTDKADIKKEKYFLVCAKKGGIFVTKEIEEFLKQLKNAGYKIAIATAARKIKTEGILKFFKLESYFDVIVSSEDYTKGKPNPEPFLLAAKRLKLEPEECAVIEDAVNGIQAANAGNITSIAITTTRTKEQFGEANKIIDSFQNLGTDIFKDM